MVLVLLVGWLGSDLVDWYVSPDDELSDIGTSLVRSKSLVIE